MTLFHPNQPAWLLARCGPLLVLLATRAYLYFFDDLCSGLIFLCLDRELCRALLSMADTDPFPEEHTTNLPRIQIIDRLCSHLIDTSREVEVSQILYWNHDLRQIFFSFKTSRCASSHALLRYQFPSLTRITHCWEQLLLFPP